MSEKLVLLLFINKNEDSLAAEVAKIKEMLNQKYKDNYELKVLDVLDNCEQAKSAGVNIVPTLLKSSPHPMAKISISDLSQMDKSFIHLDE